MHPSAIAIRTFAFLLLAALLALPAGAAVLLDADFEGEPLDQIIGTGGAENQQPISTGGVNAYVRVSPTGGQALEITDHLDYGARSVIFAFMEGAEHAAGVLTIQLLLHFAEMEDYNIYVREAGSAASSFATVAFRNDGSVAHNDADGSNGNVGSYTTGSDLLLVLTFDLDAGTCALSLDGSEILPAQSHGVTTGRGIGSVHVGFDHDPDLDGLMYLQEIEVLLDSTPADERSLSAIKTQY